MSISPEQLTYLVQQTACGGSLEAMREATCNLTLAKYSPGYIGAVASSCLVAEGATSALPSSQHFLVLLKSFISDFWLPVAEPHPKDTVFLTNPTSIPPHPGISVAEKAQLRAGVIGSVKCAAAFPSAGSSQALKELACMTWSKGKLDDTKEYDMEPSVAWPEFLPSMVGCVVPSAPPAVLLTALKILDTIVRSASHQTLQVLIGPLLASLPPLMSDATPTEIAALALGVFSSTMNSLGRSRGAFKEAIVGLAKNEIPMFLAGFLALMGEGVDPRNAACTIRAGVVKSLIAVTKNFGDIKVVNEGLKPLMGRLFADFAELETPYVSAMVHGDGYSGAGCDVYNFAGAELTRIEWYLLTIVDFLTGLLYTKKYRKLVIREAERILPLLVPYSMITRPQLDEWEASPGMFAAHEDPELSGYNLRFICGDLCNEVYSHATPTIRKLMVNLLAQKASQKSQELAHGKSSWETAEASLRLLGILVDYESDMEDTKSLLDAPGFLCTVLTPLAANASSLHPVLFARVLQCASNLCSLVPAAQMEPFITASVDAIANTTAPVILRLSGCIAVKNYMCFMEEEGTLVPMAEKLVSSVLSLLEVDEDDMRDLVYPTLSKALKVCPASTARLAPSIASSVLWLWHSNPDSHQVSELVVSVIHRLLKKQPATHVAVFGSVLAAAKEALAKHAASEPEIPGIQETALSLFSVVLDTAPVPWSPEFATGAVSEVMSLVLPMATGSDDSEILQTACSTCRSVIVNATSIVSSPSHVAAIIGFLSHLLNPSLRDMAVVYSGSLLTTVFTRLWGVDGLDAPRILTAVVERLASAVIPSFIQSLIMVFARLSTSNPAMLLGILKEAQVQVGPHSVPALPVLLNKWISYEGSFMGHYEIVVSLAGLAALIRHSDPKVNNWAVILPSEEMGDSQNKMAFSGAVMLIIARRFRKAREKAERDAKNESKAGSLGLSDEGWIHEEDEFFSDGDDEGFDGVIGFDSDDDADLFAALDDEFMDDDIEEGSAEQDEAKEDPLYHTDALVEGPKWARELRGSLTQESVASMQAHCPEKDKEALTQLMTL